MTRFRCPDCKAKLMARPEQAGRRFRCPKCTTVVTVPAAEAAGGGERGLFRGRDRFGWVRFQHGDRSDSPSERESRLSG
jgi:DNA-directed RNA polymerase subunit RPC12/RpoP